MNDDHLFNEIARLSREFERRQAQLNQFLGPTAALEQVRRATQSLADVQSQYDRSESVLRAALPYQLAHEALSRAQLTSLEIFQQRAAGPDAVAREVQRLDDATRYARQSAPPDLVGLDVVRQMGRLDEARRHAMESVAGTFLHSASMAAAMQALSDHGRLIAGPGRLDSLEVRLTRSARAIYDELATRRDAIESLSIPLIRAPALAVYTTTRSRAVDRRAPISLLAEHRDPAVEETLDLVADELEAKLQLVGVAFVSTYRGALKALEEQRDDWVRHVSTSLRELTDHLLVHLAPDGELEAFFPGPDKPKEDGEFTRKARLKYIFRNVAVGSYVKMADNHIEITLSLFYPANEGVHTLEAPFSTEQVRVYTRTVQGCIATLLEAGGY